MTNLRFAARYRLRRRTIDSAPFLSRGQYGEIGEIAPTIGTASPTYGTGTAPMREWRAKPGGGGEESD
jgi:hypothetical protein